MSLMRCSSCGKFVDTDFNDFDFELEICEDCWYSWFGDDENEDISSDDM